MTKRRAFKILGVFLAAALLGAGASGVATRLKDSSPALQRPDLLIAFGICVAVYLGGASSEESKPLAEVETLPDA